jgi:hypothetical protein
VVSLTFTAEVTSRTEPLSLDHSAVETIRRVQEDPTGAFEVAQLPAKAEQAVASSYTVAFRRAMIVSATAAALGGVLAGLTIRDRKQEHALGD